MIPPLVTEVRTTFPPVVVIGALLMMRASPVGLLVAMVILPVPLSTVLSESVVMLALDIPLVLVVKLIFPLPVLNPEPL